MPHPFLQLSPLRRKGSYPRLVSPGGFDLSRSESLRIDESGPTSSSELRSKESSSSPIFGSGSFPFSSSTLREGDLTLFGGGFQTVMGITANGCSTTPPTRFFAFVVGLDRGYELKTVGASTGGDCSHFGFWIGVAGFRTGVDREDEDVPNFGTLAETGRSFSAEPRAFRFTLRGFRDSAPNWNKSSPLVGLAAEGPIEEALMVERSEGLKAAERADFEIEGPGMSYLISSA